MSRIVDPAEEGLVKVFFELSDQSRKNLERVAKWQRSQPALIVDWLMNVGMTIIRYQQQGRQVVFIHPRDKGLGEVLGVANIYLRRRNLAQLVGLGRFLDRRTREQELQRREQLDHEQFFMGWLRPLTEQQVAQYVIPPMEDSAGWALAELGLRAAGCLQQGYTATVTVKGREELVDITPQLLP